jgi:hypothetical protein
METSTVSLAGRRWSELGVEVVISGIVRPAARYLWVYLRHALYIVFLLALCPFFFFAFAFFPSINPDGSLPCPSHSSSIFVAAWYPRSCISSNLAHCSVPYCQIRDWQCIPSISSSTHLLHWHRHIKTTTSYLGLFQSLHTRNAVQIM